MKKLLSVIFATAIILTFLPAMHASASGTDPHTITYTFAADSVFDAAGNSYAANNPNDSYLYLYDITDYANWSFVFHKAGYNRGNTLKDGRLNFNWQHSDYDNTTAYAYGAVVLKINVEETHLYTPVVNYPKSTKLGCFKTYVTPKSTIDTNNDGSVNQTEFDAFYNAYKPLGDVSVNQYNSKWDGTSYSKEFGDVLLEKGEYYLVFLLDEKDENTTISKGRVEGIVYSFTLRESSSAITVPESISGNITVGTYATEGGSVKLLDANNSPIGTVNGEASSGDVFTAVAEAASGYKFAYWKDSSGTVVSEDANYSFTAYSNTALIAVFDSDDAGNAVEFFDADGKLLSKTENIADGTVFDSITKPDMSANALFKEWSIDAETEISGIMRAVARYNDAGSIISNVIVTTPGESKKEVGYSEGITVSSSASDFAAWTRNNKLISFDNTYTYYAWNSASIAEVNGLSVEKTPIVVIEAHKNADLAGTYMIEYDAAGTTIVEAGILFGGEASTVTSAYAKAKVRNIKAHGQFTAKAATGENVESGMQNYARGYIIYKDGTDICVAYTDAIATVAE